MSIYNYKNFQSLLEAKIQFLNNLKNILKKMDHPLSKNILELSDKDLDININYFNTKDNDYLLFYQDNKVEEWVYMISDNAGILYMPQVEIELDGDFNENVLSGIEGVIESDVDMDLVRKYYPRYKHNRVVIFKTLEGKVLVNTEYLTKVRPVGSEQSGRIGRTFKSLLKSSGYDASNKEIEEFVNNYKKTINEKSSNMELVSGEDIRKYYLDKNSSSLKKGTLSSSCMRYYYCQEFLDIYVKNSSVQCLILKSETEDKIMARSLVWKLIDGKYFMDRVYTTNDYEVGLFIDYANKMGWIYKERQDSSPHGLKLDGSAYNKEIVVQLDQISFGQYPYLDTLKWMNFLEKTLTNFDNGTFTLESTIGEMGVGCDFCGGDGEVGCPECDGNDEDCDFCLGDGHVPCPDCN